MSPEWRRDKDFATLHGLRLRRVWTESALGQSSGIDEVVRHLSRRRRGVSRERGSLGECSRMTPEGFYAQGRRAQFGGRSRRNRSTVGYACPQSEVSSARLPNVGFRLQFEGRLIQTSEPNLDERVTGTAPQRHPPVRTPASTR